MDLGLPSGLLWATMNVGASAPEDPGLYFSWGSSPGHADDSGYDFSQEVYDETPAAAIEANLSLAEDMARLSSGTPWRLPTAVEFQELVTNCTSEWTTLNGVYGRLFTSNINGNTLFFPAAGYFDGTTLNGRGSLGFYWSSTFVSTELARCLYFDSPYVGPQDSGGRHSGFSVRAVASV